jgi:hypothetical protein
VISTDTAFLLGALALVGPACPTQLRLFLLTLAVADDIGALAVIAVFYTDRLAWVPLLLAVAGLGLMLVLRYALAVWRGPAYLVIALGVWVAMHESGVHPTIAGVVIALFTPAFPPRGEEVADAARLTRGVPAVAEPAVRARGAVEHRAVGVGQRTAADPVPTVVELRHRPDLRPGQRRGRTRRGDPAHRGDLTGDPRCRHGARRGQAGRHPRRGRDLGPAGARRARSRAEPLAAGWWGGAVRDRVHDLPVHHRPCLHQPGLRRSRPRRPSRVGVLAGSLCAAVLGWAVFRIGDRLHRDDGPRRPTRLDPPVDPSRDHIRGPVDAPLSLVEYGDFECPFCGRATGVVEDLRTRFGDRLRYVFRHTPLSDVHPNAMLAAEAAEAAAAQGRFWEMHDRLFAHQDRLSAADLLDHAAAIGLDVTRFSRDLATRVTPAGFVTTSPRPRPAVSRRRPPSSSTAAVTRVPTTLKRSPSVCWRPRASRWRGSAVHPQPIRRTSPGRRHCQPWVPGAVPTVDSQSATGPRRSSCRPTWPNPPTTGPTHG